MEKPLWLLAMMLLKPIGKPGIGGIALALPLRGSSRSILHWEETVDHRSTDSLRPRMSLISLRFRTHSGSLKKGLSEASILSTPSLVPSKPYFGSTRFCTDNISFERCRENSRLLMPASLVASRSISFCWKALSLNASRSSSCRLMPCFFVSGPPARTLRAAALLAAISGRILLLMTTSIALRGSSSSSLTSPSERTASAASGRSSSAQRAKTSLLSPIAWPSLKVL
mmetsp:Transcript_7410/g.15405  ORF Transcript_7410/g.15405 Transcript_7410/m.15405 type:complete len:227 (-) Transcript_7410:248-928(-)